MKNHSAVKARAMTTRAIKRGILVRQPCEVCGDPATIAHHDDYEYPLKVRWLCRKHHTRHHKLNGAGKNALWFDRDWYDVGYKVMLGDIISFGKVKLRVDQVIITGNTQKVRLTILSKYIQCQTLAGHKD